MYQIPPVVGGALDQPLLLTSTIMTLRNYKDTHDAITGEIPVKEDKIPEDAKLFVGYIKALRFHEDEQIAARKSAEQEHTEDQEQLSA